MQRSTILTLLAFTAIGLTGPAAAKEQVPAAAAEKPSATATFTGETVAVGVGFTWGKGVLTFQGKTYPFKVDGLSAIGAGVTKITGTGTIYHLTSPAEFAGTYGAAGGGASIGTHGRGGASLRNDKGVVIEFRAKEKGVSLNLDLSGVHIRLLPS